MCITHHTGIGRAACEILFYEIVNDGRTKFIPYIQYKMRKPMLNGCCTGIVEAVQVTASGFFFGRTGAGVVPGLHGNAYHFISLIMEHECSNGTVNTPTHCHQHLAFSAHSSKDTYSRKIVFYGLPKTCKLPYKQI